MPEKIQRWQPPKARPRSTRERDHYVSREWRARRARILVRDANRCRDCGMVVSGKQAHVDHIIPLEDGGTDADANLAVRCASCHSRKTIGEQRRKGLL